MDEMAQTNLTENQRKSRQKEIDDANKFIMLLNETRKECIKTLGMKTDGYWDFIILLLLEALGQTVDTNPDWKVFVRSIFSFEENKQE